MRRYAHLVHQAMGDGEWSALNIEIYSLNLRSPISLPRWLPPAVGTWLKHGWLLLTARYRILKSRPDLVHILDGSFGYLAGRCDDVPAITTIHDLIPLKRALGIFGDNKPHRLTIRLIRQTVSAWSGCARLVAVSASTAADLEIHTQIPAEKISTVPVALDPEFYPQVSAVRLDRTMGAKGDMLILHVGNNGFYKNRAGVIRIFSRIRANLSACLIMAGSPPNCALLNLVQDLALEEFVEFNINPSDNELKALYHRADLFLFPSIYEGFGWPPLEAMAQGCPVVCSSAGSLPEVVGDAALTASVEDEYALAEQCVAVLGDKVLAAEMSKKGQSRARQFSLERMGHQLVSVYGRALGVSSADFAVSPADHQKT